LEGCNRGVSKGAQTVVRSHPRPLKTRNDSQEKTRVFKERIKQVAISFSSYLTGMGFSWYE